jgi:hypothetical protein
MDTSKRITTRPLSRKSQSPLLGNAEVFQEVDATGQLLRFSSSVRGDMM